VPATIKDLARETGLSLATISKYLNGGNVLARNKALIDESVERLNFRVNTLARALKTNRTMTVGVLIPEFSALFFSTIASGVEETLSRHGYGILLCDSHSNKRSELEAVEFMVNKQVDGIIAVTGFDGMSSFVSARKRNVPVVLIDNVPPNRIYDVVTTDNLNSSREATSYLLSMGHVKCGVICGPNEIYTARERLAGYLDAFRRVGLEPDMQLVETTEYSFKGGYEGFRRLYERRPDMTAVFATSYDITIGAIMAVQNMQIQIPDQLSFVGFDDILLTDVIRPKLTLVSQPMHRIGTVAANHLRKLMTGAESGGKAITVTNKLILGESVRRI
jgi:LacI family transcriptional regulator